LGFLWLWLGLFGILAWCSARGVWCLFLLLEANGGVFNVVTENAALSDIIAAVKEVVPDCVVQYVEPPYQQQVSYGLVDSRIRSSGYEPRGSLRLGVREVVEKFRAFLGSRRR